MKKESKTKKKRKKKKERRLKAKKTSIAKTMNLYNFVNNLIGERRENPSRGVL